MDKLLFTGTILHLLDCQRAEKVIFFTVVDWKKFDQ